MKLKSKLSYYFLLLMEFTIQEAISCLFPVLNFAIFLVGPIKASSQRQMLLFD